jgi:hypothetical protein
MYFYSGFLHPEIFANLHQATVFAFWISGETGVTTMQNKPVVSFMYQRFRDIFDQLFFDGQWGVCFGTDQA